MTTRHWQKFAAVGEIGEKGVELRTTDRQVRVANFQLGTTRRWRNERGESQAKTEWHRVVAWNTPGGRGPRLADVCNQLIKPGDLVFVEGRVEYRSYEQRGTREKVWVTEIVASEVIRLTDDRPFEDDGDESDEERGRGGDGGMSAAAYGSPYAD